jgi:hypothetical protein
MFLGKMKWRRDEPEPLPPERATWLKQAVHRCIAEGFLTVEEGGRILAEKLETEFGPGKLREHYAKEEDWKATETDDFHEPQ